MRGREATLSRAQCHPLQPRRPVLVSSRWRNAQVEAGHVLSPQWSTSRSLYADLQDDLRRRERLQVSVNPENPRESVLIPGAGYGFFAETVGPASRRFGRAVRRGRARRPLYWAPRVRHTTPDALARSSSGACARPR